jgi:hypothetical protein
MSARLPYSKGCNACRRMKVKVSFATASDGGMLAYIWFSAMKGNQNARDVDEAAGLVLAIAILANWCFVP